MRFPSTLPSQFYFQRPGLEMGYQWLQKGLLKLNLMGEPTLEELERFYQITLDFEQWMRDNDFRALVISDLSQLDIKGFKTRSFALKRFRWEDNSSVLENYLIIQHPLVRTLSRLISTGYKRVSIHFCSTEQEAMSLAKKALENYLELESSPSQSPPPQSIKLFMSQLEAHPRIEHLQFLNHYQSPHSDFESFSFCLNHTIIYHYWKGLIHRSDLEAHLSRQEHFFDRVLSRFPHVHTFSDVSEVKWLTKKAMFYILPYLKNLKPRSSLDIVITVNSSGRGFLQILNRFLQSMPIDLHMAETLDEAFDIFENKYSPKLRSESVLVIPSNVKELQKMVKEQHEQLIIFEEKLDVHYNHMLQALSQMVSDQNFKPIILKGAPTPKLREMNDVINAVQQDMRFFIDGMHAEIDNRKAAETEALALSQTKTRFLANMSHELRTPLNSVIGFSNILLKNKNQNLSDKDLEYISRIHANSLHLLQLVNDVLDISKIEAGKHEKYESIFELSALIHDTLQFFLPDSEKKELPLVYEDEGPLYIHSDQQKCRQIIVNFVSNAIKFTDSGRVVVRVDVDESQLYIRVKDTGVGIPEERFKDIFQAFTQVDESFNRKYPGTGLGLRICQSFAQLLGGTIDLESSMGEGSTFSLCLPISVLRDSPSGILPT